MSLLIPPHNPAQPALLGNLYFITLFVTALHLSQLNSVRILIICFIHTTFSNFLPNTSRSFTLFRVASNCKASLEKFRLAQSSRCVTLITLLQLVTKLRIRGDMPPILLKF